MAIRKTKTGYRAEVYLGVDPMTGKKIRKTKTFKLMKDAKAWEIEILKNYKDGNLIINNNMNLGEYLDYWYDTYVMVNTEYGTQKGYRSMIKNIKEHLGHIPLVDLKTPHIDRFYADLKLKLNKKGKRQYSDTTILKRHKLLNQAIERAIGWNLLIKNPVRYANPPKEGKPDINTWTIDQVKYFLSSVKDYETHIVYYPTLISFHTGMRVGEICSLKWENVSFKKGYIDIKYNAVEKKGQGVVLGDPKTESSKSKVMMTDELIEELKELKKNQKIHKLKTGIELDFVCRWEDGRPFRPTYISKSFKYHVERLGMPRMTFHGLRHTHASILFELGATSQEISKRLRHSRVSTTDDIYIHLKEDTKKSTADLFNQAVGKNK